MFRPRTLLALTDNLGVALARYLQAGDDCPFRGVLVVVWLDHFGGDLRRRSEDVRDCSRDLSQTRTVVRKSFQTSSSSRPPLATDE